MEVKPVRPQAKAIQDRFFEAIDILIAEGRLAGLQTFCKEYGLHRPKYSNIRTMSKDPGKGTGYKFIDIDALSYLVRDYNISSDWLLLGRGKMFVK